MRLFDLRTDFIGLIFHTHAVSMRRRYFNVLRTTVFFQLIDVGGGVVLHVLRHEVMIRFLTKSIIAVFDIWFNYFLYTVLIWTRLSFSNKDSRYYLCPKFWLTFLLYNLHTVWYLDIYVNLPLASLDGCIEVWFLKSVLSELRKTSKLFLAFLSNIAESLRGLMKQKCFEPWVFYCHCGCFVKSICSFWC